MIVLDIIGVVTIVVVAMFADKWLCQAVPAA